MLAIDENRTYIKRNQVKIVFSLEFVMLEH